MTSQYHCGVYSQNRIRNALQSATSYNCVPVWHYYALTKTQTDHLEALQKRAIQTIFQSFTRGMPYNSTPFAANLTPLAARRDEISRKFFEDITQPSSCLHHLLPAQKDESLISRLRSQEKFTRI